jgi:hypothetical protein
MYSTVIMKNAMEELVPGYFLITANILHIL